jgi:uncharacterized protein (TIGR00369 family)
MDAAELAAFMDAAFGTTLGWTIEDVDGTGVRIRQPVDSGRDLRPGGTVSGPVLMGLADGAAYVAVLSRIGPQALAVTSNLNINFLRRPRPGDLVARATLLKVGRTLALVDVLLHCDTGGPDDLDRPVAQAVVTYSMALVDGAGTGGPT